MGRSLKILSGLLICLLVVTVSGTSANAAKGTPVIEMYSMGDSVAAGEGLGYNWEYVLKDDKSDGIWVAQQDPPIWSDEFRTPVYGECHNTIYAYPVVIGQMQKPGDWFRRAQAACTGASAENGVLRRQVFDDGTAAFQPQLGSTLPGYDLPPTRFSTPDVFILTLGADDVHFKDVITACYVGPSPCDLNTDLRQKLSAGLDAQKKNLEIVVSEIERQQKAGGKTPYTVLTTYYDPFPRTYDTTCADLTPVGTSLLGLSADEMTFLKLSLFQLNDNIRAVAKKHRSVQLVDIESAFKGHEWCSQDPWVIGPSLMILYGLDNTSPFHPTVQGQRVIGTKVGNTIIKHFGL